MKFLAAVIATLGAHTGPAFAQGGERITSPVGGVSIEVPKGWRILPPDASLENMRGLQPDSPEFRRNVQRVTAPVFTIIKYPMDRDLPGINPTIKVNYALLPVSLRGRDDVALMTVLLDGMRTGFGDIEILDGPAPALLGGAPGAHARVSYTVTGRVGIPFETISEMWVVQRGDYVVTLGVSYAPREPAVTQAEIVAAVMSFRID